MEVGSAEPDEIGIVEVRRFDPLGVSCDGVTHAEL